MPRLLQAQESLRSGPWCDPKGAACGVGCHEDKIAEYFSLWDLTALPYEMASLRF